MHMRTTITIDPALLRRVQKISGRSGYSDAISTSLHNYAALWDRLTYLHRLYNMRLPHRMRHIKQLRRKGQWSS